MPQTPSSPKGKKNCSNLASNLQFTCQPNKSQVCVGEGEEILLPKKEPIVDNNPTSHPTVLSWSQTLPYPAPQATHIILSQRTICPTPPSPEVQDPLQSVRQVGI